MIRSDSSAIGMNSDGVRAEVDDRLVVHGDLVQLDGAGESLLCPSAPQGVLSHARFEQLVPAPASLLRRVHGDVGVAE